MTTIKSRSFACAHIHRSFSSTWSFLPVASSGIATPPRENLARVDKQRTKQTSNKEWTTAPAPDAKVTKMKDGRTPLAHKAEHAVDLDTGAIVAGTLQGADQGDTTTIIETGTAAAEQVEDAQRDVEAPQALDELVGDQGDHQTMVATRRGRPPVVHRRAGPRPPRLGGTLELEEPPCDAGLPDDAGQRAKREFGMVRDRNGRRGAAGSLLHHDVTATLSNR